MIETLRFPQGDRKNRLLKGRLPLSSHSPGTGLPQGPQQLGQQRSFTGVGMPRAAPRAATWAFRASISVVRPASTSCSMEERLAAVTVETWRNRSFGVPG